MKIRRRFGLVFDKEKIRPIYCIVTGEMSDGRKVWTECDDNMELINTERQYTLQTGGGLSEFVAL